MPDATSSKENDCPHKTQRGGNAHSKSPTDRSPARRKNTDNYPSSSSSPSRQRNPFAETMSNNMTPSTPAPPAYASSPKKVPSGGLLPPPSQSPSKHHAYSQQYVESSPPLSTSPPTSSHGNRWAGPAFGNAPHPSSLPLPEFPPMYNSTSNTSSFVTAPESARLTSAPDLFGMLGLHSHSHGFSSSPPTGPFPYGALHGPPSAPTANLAQLSTDLRRMLNINGAIASATVFSVDHMMVPPNSA